MISKIISVHPNDDETERFINYYEFYQHMFLHFSKHSILNKLYWEHEDIVAVTEQYCRRNYLANIRNNCLYSEILLLLNGPDLFMLGSISSRIRVGENYLIQLVINESKVNGESMVGKIELDPYIINKDSYTGLCYLDYKYNHNVPLNWISINENQKLYLKISGDIRILSNIDCILNFKTG